MTAQPERATASRGFVRGPQNLVSGLALVALAAYAIYLTRDLPQGTLRAMGPAMLPRWLAFGVGACGVLLVVSAFLKQGDPLRVSDWSPFVALTAIIVAAYLIGVGTGTSFFLVVFVVAALALLVIGWMALTSSSFLETSGLRGAFFVCVGVLAFFLTIRGQAIGPVNIPQLGLIGAGPLAMFISGAATPEVRWRDLLILALGLTSFCILLFGDLLNLPIPLYPLWMSDLYPAGWSNDARLRATAVALALLALLVYVISPKHKEREPIDVVPNETSGVV